MPLATAKPQSEILAHNPADTNYRKLDTLAAATKFYPLCFAGIDTSNGLAKKFDGSSATVWLDGVWDMDNVANLDAADAGVEQLRVSKPFGFRVAVAAGGVAATDVNKPVYAISGNDYQVSLTPPATGFTEAIGYVEDVISATDVLIKPRYKKQPAQGAGGGRMSFAFPVNLASVTGTQDVVTNFTPGFAGKVVGFSYVANVPATTASKLATFNLEVNTTDLTGGVIALTTALATPMGKTTNSTAITAGNAFGASDSFSIEASSVTAFAEGSGTFVVVVEPAANN
ncbi:hypothetical protein [Limnoglobus roseus]|uniref:Uncharacterized protein n=1 Tax=Limnoglobus roseus TaxID=2598579 RepID=A0A5C1AJE2_9BACT|nr:hypothetical protein [Limnoglobus roseus]QEL18303.1 hypothetical protein PX52LOC_05324 [Limnoglobus roseus]